MERLLQFLRDEAGRRGITNADLAKILGVSPTALSYWMNGKWEPSVKSLALMAEGLGMPYQELAAMAESDLQADHAKHGAVDHML